MVDKMNDSTKIKRLLWIDFLKFFAIFLVLWGHCIQHFTYSFRDNPIYLWIYSFHMPLFMMLSGWFASHLLKKSLFDVVKLKFRQLLLPSIIWGTILFLVAKYLMTSHSYLHIIYYSYWFLKSLFSCMILFVVGLKYFKNKKVGLIFVLFISQLCNSIPYLEFLQLRYMFPCFVMGYLFSQNYIWLQRNIKIITLVSFICFVSLFCFFNKDLLWPISYIHNIGDIVTVYYKLIIGMFGSVMCIGFAHLLPSNKLLQYMANIGKHTLAIYILQAIILELMLKHFVNNYINFHEINVGLSSLIYFPLISVAVLILILVIISFLDKINASWLFDLNKIFQKK